MSTQEKKVGMYDEMPKVKIGKYSICLMSNSEDNKSVWIVHDDGEGGEFRIDLLENVIEKFYNDHF